MLKTCFSGNEMTDEQHGIPTIQLGLSIRSTVDGVLAYVYKTSDSVPPPTSGK